MGYIFQVYFMCFRLNNPLHKGMPLFLTVEYIARNLGRERYIYIASIFMRDRNSWTLARVTRGKSSSPTRARCIVRATVLGMVASFGEGFIVTTISPWAALAR